MVLNIEQQRKEDIAKARREEIAREAARREPTKEKIIFVGGERFIARRGRIVARERGRRPSVFLAAERQRKAEATRKAEAIKKAKELSLQKQREQAKLKLQMERRLFLKLRRLSIRERKEFFRQQAITQRADALRKLKEEGKRLTSKSERLIKKVLEEKGFTQELGVVKFVRVDAPSISLRGRDLTSSQQNSIIQIIRGRGSTEEKIQKIKNRLKFKLSKEGLRKLQSGIKKKEERRMMLIEAERKKPLRQLIKEKDIAGFGRQSVIVGGRKLVGLSSFLISKATGKKQLSKEERNRAGNIVGEFGLFLGIAPLTATRGEILAKIPKETVVKFVGVQKQKGNVLVADIIFTSSGKRIGVARGVTIAKGKKAVSFVAGRLGKPTVRKAGVRFPSGKAVKGTFKLTKKEFFAGIEQSIIGKRKFPVKKLITNVGEVQTNVKGLLQLSRGGVVSGKGIKLFRTGISFPSGRITKGARLTLRGFSSVAGVIPKKDLNIIVGKTLLTRGQRIKFIGLIKGSSKIGSKGFKLLPKERLLFQQALGNVASVISATAKSPQVTRLSPIAQGVIASIKTIRAKGNPITTQGIKIQLRTVGIGKLKRISKPKLTKKQESQLKTRQRTLLKQETAVRQQIKQKTIPKFAISQRSALRQRLATILKTKAILKQQARRGIVTPKFLKPKGIALLPIIKIGAKLKKKKIKLKKVKGGFNVFAKPVKGKKLIRINKVPLTKTKAKDLRNFIIDTSLSRTGSIRRTKARPQRPKLKAPSGYAKKTSLKFRRFRIVKGKRRLLPKGKVIEKRTRLLDTKQERKGITLRRRIAQLKKPLKRKSKVRKR